MTSRPTTTPTTAFHVRSLSVHQPTTFDISPDLDWCSALADRLDLSALRKLRFTGEVRADGSDTWLLTGRLGATVVQPCTVTLNPVTTRIDEKVQRRFTPHMPDQPDSDTADAEIEMPEDETLEPLGTHIDPAQVMEEALALAIPLYPRAEEAELGEAVYTEPGHDALRDEDTKPFAGLADLKRRLGGPDA